MFEYPVGAYEDALVLLGELKQTRRAEVRVERGQVRAYCSQLEDGRAAYWVDGDQGDAPPGLLMCLFMQLPWKPGGVTPPPSAAGATPLPGSTVLAVSTETTFHRQLRVGDLLTVTSTLESISPLKRTKLGSGHFVVDRATYRDEHNQLVAENITTTFRFDPEDNDDV